MVLSNKTCVWPASCLAGLLVGLGFFFFFFNFNIDFKKTYILVIGNIMNKSLFMLVEIANNLLLFSKTTTILFI